MMREIAHSIPGCSRIVLQLAATPDEAQQLYQSIKKQEDTV